MEPSGTIWNNLPARLGPCDGRQALPTLEASAGKLKQTGTKFSFRISC